MSNNETTDDGYDVSGWFTKNLQLVVDGLGIDIGCEKTNERAEPRVAPTEPTTPGRTPG